MKTENPASQKTQLYRATQTSGMVYRSFLIDHRFFVSGAFPPGSRARLFLNGKIVTWNPYTSLFVRTNGVLRVKFAYRADAGTTLYFGIKDAFGNVIGKKELTFVARKAIINAVTIDLKTYDFVKVFFQTTNGAAVVGLTEVISHNHEFEDGNGYPIYDRNNCATIRFCKSCGFEVDFIKHNLTVVKEVACETDGLEEYSWLKGRLSIRVVVEATGHEYEEIHTFATCETEGKSVYHKCRVCGDIYEKPEDIVTFAPLGHGESEWITEIAPTTLAASGCQIVLFTTGRGTPFSTFVPTFKIASNDFLAEKKSGRIDFNAYEMDEKPSIS